MKLNLYGGLHAVASFWKTDVIADIDLLRKKIKEKHRIMADKLDGA